jgi:hypothetical protein
MNSFSGNGDGGKSQAFGTRIQVLIPPDKRGKTRISTLSYLDAGTAHTLTTLRPIGRTKVNGAAASGQAVVNIVADPGVATGFVNPLNNVAIVNTNGIAANDLVAIRELDGITRFYKVSSVSTLAITLTANLVAGCAGGEDFWDFGITTDTDPRTGSAHPALKSGAGSTVTTFNERDNGVVATIGADEPILLDSNNATAAGTFTAYSWGYTVN